MRILLGVHKFFPVHGTGTEVLTLELARGLRRRGHTVSILAGEPHSGVGEKRSPWLGREAYDNFPVFRLHYHRLQGDPLRAHFDAPDRLRLVREVIDEILPDLVHLTHLRAFSSRVIPELRAQDIPVFFTPTDFWAVCPKFQLYRDFDDSLCQGPDNIVDCLRCCRPMPAAIARGGLRLSRTGLRHLHHGLKMINSLDQRLSAVIADVNQASLVVPASKFVAKMLIRYGVERHRTTIVPFGVDIGELPGKMSVPARFTAEKPLRLGFIGSLVPVKGVHVILESLHKLGDDRHRVALSIYGKAAEDDPYQGQLQNMTDSLGGIAQFRGTFSHEQIGAVLRGLHVLIVPSIWYENTPLVLCSALAAGVFVLVSNLGGMTEIVVEGQTGTAFQTGSSEDLAERLRNLLNGRPDLRETPPEQLWRRRGTAEYVADIETLYREVIKDN